MSSNVEIHSAARSAYLFIYLFFPKRNKITFHVLGELCQSQEKPLLLDSSFSIIKQLLGDRM